MVPPRGLEAAAAPLGMAALVMLAITALCQLAPAALVRLFNADPGVNLWLVQREFGRRLNFEPAAVSPHGAAAAS